MKDELKQNEADIFSDNGIGTLVLFACQDPNNYNPDIDFNNKISINQSDLE